MRPSPEDFVAISDLYARYCLALDHDDLEAWVVLFTPDASFEVYGRSFDGHDGLREMIRGAPGGLHLGGTPVIEMASHDEARARQNLLFVGRDGVTRSAVYADVLHRSELGWRIARRRCRFIVADGLSDRPER